MRDPAPGRHLQSRDLLAAATAELGAAGVPNPAADALLLAEAATGFPAWQLRLGCAVPAAANHRFRELVAARARRIPTQHLTGTAHFRYLTLQVGPGVFVPRPETELLVDEVAAHVAGAGRALVVDLCTGSGAIALSVASELRGVRVVGVEADPAALAYAQRNALAARDAVVATGSQLAVFGGDATRIAEPGAGLWHVRGLVDVVVANPPYIPDAAVPRDPEVRDHDPQRALYGGPDGLDIVRPLAQQAALLLRPGGLLIIEHADSQGDDAGAGGVPGVLRGQSSWTEVVDHLDLAGRPRYTSAKRC